MSKESREPDKSPSAPQTAGERLRAAREAQGLRVDTAAEALGFARGIVIALEADDYARLGAPVYVRGYLRKYARYLDLPGDELIAQYERGAAPREPELKPRLSPIVAPGGGNGRRWLVGLVTVVIIAILVIAGVWGWRYVRHVRKTAQIPPAAAASATSARVGNPAPTGFAALPPTATATAAAVSASATAPDETSAAVAAASATIAPAAAAPQPQLILHLTAASWIEVRAADHTRLFYDLAPAGKTLRFDGKHGALTVYLGNAPGVTVRINGRPYPIPAASRSGNTARFTVTLASPPASTP